MLIGKTINTDFAKWKESITVFLPSDEETARGQDSRCNLRAGSGDPNSRHAPNEGERPNEYKFKDQGTDKGDNGGN